jgi:small-conductance mechanosensitive channel
MSTSVQVPYGTDVRALAPRLVAAVSQVPRVLAEPGPGCELANFAPDGLELQIGFWIGDPENGQGGVRSQVNLVVLDLLTEQGIEIPFPQRVVRQLGGDTPTKEIP